MVFSAPTVPSPLPSLWNQRLNHHFPQLVFHEENITALSVARVRAAESSARLLSSRGPIQSTESMFSENTRATCTLHAVYIIRLRQTQERLRQLNASQEAEEDVVPSHPRRHCGSRPSPERPVRSEEDAEQADQRLPKASQLQCAIDLQKLDRVRQDFLGAGR